MIAIDLGNKYTTISDSKHTMQKQSTIAVQVLNQINIGLPRSLRYVLYDLVAILGTKFMDEEFGRYTKFYAYDHSMSKWGKIEVGIPTYQGMKHKKLNVDTLVAMYLRQFIDEFRNKYYSAHMPNNKSSNTVLLQQFLLNHKFYITVSALATHPHRFSLAQVCQIAGIQCPILVNSTHAALCSYYSKSKKHIKQPQTICVVEFGDRGAAVAMYKIQGSQQKIIQVIQYRGIKVGGYHLTKLVAEFIVEEIKREKGLDITRHSQYMSFLHSECETLKINTINSEDKQAYIRIPDLPDDSEFGKTINYKLLTQILQPEINKIIKQFQQIISKHKNTVEILIMGGSSAIPLFEHKIQEKAGKNTKLIKLKKEDVCEGIFAMQQQQIIVFDICESNYQAIGQQGFRRKLIEIGENIPDRRSQKTKFPAGELEFNLRVQENGTKIGHFLLEARPKQTEFGLSFQIDRNKLVSLHVRTQKGKIELPANYEAISAEQLQKEIAIVRQYEQQKK